MKLPTSKIVGVIAIVISIISFLLLILSLIFYMFPIGNNGGVGRPFSFWIYSVIVALFSLLFFVIDGALCIKKVICRENRLFNIILALVLFGSIPMIWFFGQSADLLASVIWNIYYVVMVALEIWSIFVQKQWDDYN